MQEEVYTFHSVAYSQNKLKKSSFSLTCVFFWWNVSQIVHFIHLSCVCSHLIIQERYVPLCQRITGRKLLMCSTWSNIWYLGTGECPRGSWWRWGVAQPDSHKDCAQNKSSGGEGEAAVLHGCHSSTAATGVEEWRGTIGGSPPPPLLTAMISVLGKSRRAGVKEMCWMLGGRKLHTVLKNKFAVVLHYLSIFKSSN